MFISNTAGVLFGALCTVMAVVASFMGGVVQVSEAGIYRFEYQCGFVIIFQN